MIDRSLPARLLLPARTATAQSLMRKPLVHAIGSGSFNTFKLELSWDPVVLRKVSAQRDCAGGVLEPVMRPEPGKHWAALRLDLQSSMSTSSGKV